MPDIFERVRLSPAQFRTVAERRFADAEYLRKSGNNERANGAIYLGGFLLECLLKARLLEEHPWLQAPLSPEASADEQRLWSLCYRSHELDRILEHLPETRQRLRDLEVREGRGALRRLQSLCTQWTIQARYSPRSATMAEARKFLGTVKELKEWLN